MERNNYIDRLKCLNSVKIPKIPSLAIDTETDKATQTHRGYWIDEKNVRQNNAGHSQINSSGYSTFEEPEQKQVQLVGCVNVSRCNLIPDGHGNYFAHVLKKDIQRNDPSSSYRDSRPMPPYHRTDGKRKRPHQNNSHPRQHPSGSNAPYTHRPHQPSHHGEKPRFVGNSLPMGGNNLAEDLLRMQHMNMRNPRSNKPH